MSARIFTGSRIPCNVKCRDMRTNGKGLHGVDSRHGGISGFDQRVYSRSAVTLIGAGGINGEVAEGFARKGIGRLNILDGDDVELSNLNRQHFTRRDIGKNKAVCLAKNLRRDGYMGTIIDAYPFFFQEAVEKGITLRSDLVVCGVDNDRTRVAVGRYAIANNMPAIFIVVSWDGNQGYTLIQEPGKACFGCAIPDALNDDTLPCPGVPAIKDILKVVAGLTLYAADTVLMTRKRDWNYRMVFLAGFIDDLRLNIERNPLCALCSNTEVGPDLEKQ